MFSMMPSYNSSFHEFAKKIGQAFTIVVWLVAAGIALALVASMYWLPASHFFERLLVLGQW